MSWVTGRTCFGLVYTLLCLCSLMAILSCQCYTWSNVFFLGSTQVAESRFVMPESALDVFPVVPPRAILPTLPTSQAFGTVVPNLAFSTSLPASYSFWDASPC